MAQALSSWDEVGQRVAEARGSAGITQERLAIDAQIERTALVKIELGRRGLSSLELARIASALRRPIEWFVTESPPSVVSRRTGNADQVDGLDAHIDAFARDVALLIELKVLPPITLPSEQMPESLQHAERLADRLREGLGNRTGPLHNLAVTAEQLGLYVASLKVDHHLPDGAYVALEGAGATIVNGAHDSGRRRFTLAHELGHHVMADEYSTDWSIGQAKEEREKHINAFAVHLLMPRQSVAESWNTYGGQTDPRDAMIHLAIEYRVSWTAACGHLQNLGLINRATENDIRRRPPGRVDLLERGLFVVEELAPPSLSPAFTRAAIRAYRGHKIGASRALELLRDTLLSDDLPEVDVVPREALRAEFMGTT